MLKQYLTQSAESNAKLSEVSSQISTLRAMLLDRKVSSAEARPAQGVTPSPASVLPSWQLDATKSPYSYETRRKESEASTVRTPGGKEPYPKDFASVMQMVANGQTPPGIRTDIVDRPLDSNAKIESGSRPAPLKPYERAKGSVETAFNDAETSKNSAVGRDDTTV